VAVIVLAGVGIGTAAASYFRAVENDVPMEEYDAELAREVTRARTTDSFITSLQERLTKNPNDSQGHEFLGVAYLQKARETGDPGYYARAEGLLGRALELEPGNFGAMTALGAVALSRHQFREALEWGARAREIAPFLPHNYGVIGDAQIELGMYEEAARTIQTMIDQRPDLASFARVSYLRELHGDEDGAIRAMQQAVDAGGANAENTNWARAQLGNLYFDRGQLNEAESKYREALANYPDYHYALAAQGRVNAARGNFETAVEYYLRAIEIIPLPQYAVELGDLYTVMGREKDAERMYDLVRFEQELYGANGVDVDAELALFDADHKQNLEEASARARNAYDRRPSIQIADVLAWTLYRSGKYAEAEKISKEALRLGTRDALMEYHAAMIAYQLGKYDAAKKLLADALALNPHFSIRYAGGARELLDALKAGERPEVEN
jgi:tetratricopeptide (TPR) repeat protein